MTPPAMPIRFQLQRVKGWRMPPGSVSVARPGVWGNPWHVGRDGDAAYCAEQFRRAVAGEAVIAWPVSLQDTVRAIALPDAGVVRAMLRGLNLGCFCRLGEPCHADVLLEIANAPEPAGVVIQLRSSDGS